MAVLAEIVVAAEPVGTADLVDSHHTAIVADTGPVVDIVAVADTSAVAVDIVAAGIAAAAGQDSHLRLHSLPDIRSGTFEELDQLVARRSQSFRRSDQRRSVQHLVRYDNSGLALDRSFHTSA